MDSSRTVTFAGVVSPGLTLFPLRRGRRDPCFQVGDDDAIWRTSLLRSGSVTARISRAAADAVECTAWGSGAEEFLDALPTLLGAHDDASGFVPTDPTVAAAHRRVPHLRLGRTDRVLEALIPAVIEQRVPGADAFRSWRLLVTKFGTPAPGPRRRGCGCRRRPTCGGTSRRGSSTAPMSIPDGPEPWSAVRSGRRRWSGWRHGRPQRPETR